MAVEADDRGRLYLPKSIREHHGDRFRVVDLSNRVVLIPIEGDPLAAARDLVDDSFDDISQADAIEQLQAELDTEIAELRTRQSKEDLE